MALNDTKLIIQNVSLSDVGVYQCLAANSVGQVSRSSVITVTGE